MKKLLFLFVIVINLVVYSQTIYTATITGNWSTMTWSPTGTPGSTDDVIIPDGVTVTIDQNFTINNLTVGGGTSGGLQFNSTTSDTLIVNGNILIQPGSVFKVLANTIGASGNTAGLLHILNLHGNLTNNAGTGFVFRAGSATSTPLTLSVCNLVLSGSTNSILTTNATYTGGSNVGMFNAVTINKTGGAKVNCGSDIVMSGGSSSGLPACNTTLVFVSGNIETGTHVWNCLTTTAANVSGYSSNSYLIGAMGRGMSSSGNSSKDFPVGDANGYRLFTLKNLSSGSATGHCAIVRCIAGNANNGTTTYNNGIDKVSTIRYYQVSYNTIGAGATSMSFYKFSPSYGVDDYVNVGNTQLRVAWSTNLGVTWNGINQTIPHVTDLTSPPTMISPDSLTTALSLSAGVGSIFVSLADSTNGINPLPVELTSFTALKTNNAVNLNWSTATELSNAGFNIERSSGISGSWIKIGFINGATNSSTIKNYSFSDSGPFVTGQYKYRLKQIDLNGSSKYSKIVEVDVTQPTKYALNQNYPNPFNPSTIIEYALPKAGNVELIVFNSIGQEVSRLVNGFQASGNYSISFNSNNLSTGVYFYQLKTADYTNIKKMILIK